MNRVAATAIAAGMCLAIAVPADSAGCLRGAAVGGVGGHFVGRGHAFLGAAAGCAVGHHRATVAARQKRLAAQQARQQHPATH